MDFDPVTARSERIHQFSLSRFVSVNIEKRDGRLRKMYVVVVTLDEFRGIIYIFWWLIPWDTMTLFSEGVGVVPPWPLKE